MFSRKYIGKQIFFYDILYENKRVLILKIHLYRNFLNNIRCLVNYLLENKYVPIIFAVIEKLFIIYMQIFNEYCFTVIKIIEKQIEEKYYLDNSGVFFVIYWWVKL